jgi:hypothetical protein
MSCAFIFFIFCLLALEGHTGSILKLEHELLLLLLQEAHIFFSRSQRLGIFTVSSLCTED